jgi:hypothetical protein
MISPRIKACSLAIVICPTGENMFNVPYKVEQAPDSAQNTTNEGLLLQKTYTYIDPMW